MKNQNIIDSIKDQNIEFKKILSNKLYIKE